MIDENLSHLSDLAFEGAMAGYLVALVCHTIESASRRATLPARELVTAGSGRTATSSAGLDSGVDSANAADGPGQRETSTADRLGRAAVIVTAIGFASHVLALVLRGAAAHRPPWGNMYEFTLMITGAAVAGWLVVLWRNHAARPMGMYVMTPITVLVFLAGTVLYTKSAPVVPILNTYWLNIHVVTISLSSGVLMLSGLAAAAYLARLRFDERVASGAATGVHAVTRLPVADKLDRIAYRSAIIAFPFYTFAIIAGALWAEVAWGSYWSWDPKEVVALVSWVVYAGYLHSRATAGWRGKPAAWISVLGLGTIIFNLFFINMVVSGLHSYAGLN
ncbi:MAG: c-type cytochrome biogenesis protein CcsB [Nakamurella sp.]